MLSEGEKEAIQMLDKFITEHKLYNIKHSDGLEGNIKIILNLIVKLQKENKEKDKQIDLMAEILRYHEELKYEVCKDCEPLKEELCGEPKKTQFEPTELKCVKKYFEKLVKEKG